MSAAQDMPLLNVRTTRLVDVAPIRASLTPLLGACHGSITRANMSILVVDALLIMFYVGNAIRPIERWQHIESFASDTYHIPRVLCGKMNLVISLGLAGALLQLAIASHALHSKPKSGWVDEMEKHSDKLSGAFNRLLVLTAIAVCILVVILAFAIIRSAVLGVPSFLWVTVPVVVAVPQDSIVNYTIKCLSVASKSRVTALAEKIEKVNGGANAWGVLVQSYMELRAELGDLWMNNYSVLLLSSLVLDGGGCFLFFMLSLDQELVVGWRIAMVIFSLMLAFSVLEKLGPLAEITSLCQSTAFRSDSQPKTIPQAAMRVASQRPEETVHAVMFCTNAHNFPAGISITSGIEVSSALIMQCCKALAIYGSAATNLALRYIFDKHGVARTK